MATLREIRRKIHSVDNIQKITQAMELVAASRLRKAQTKRDAARPYASKIRELVDLLVNASEERLHPFMAPRKIKKTGLIIIAGDRGLCGGYNQTIFSAAEKFLQAYQPNQVELIPIGRKTVDYFETKRWAISSKIEDWGGKISYSQIAELTRTLIDCYLSGQLDEIWLIYTHFINMTTREVRLEKFLTIDSHPTHDSVNTTTSSSPMHNAYLFEPDPAAILAKVLEHYCITTIQAALNDAYISELAARISSMRNATKNAEEMIEKLTLTRNKVRQSGITKELIEITSGAESLR